MGAAFCRSRPLLGFHQNPSSSRSFFRQAKPTILTACELFPLARRWGGGAAGILRDSSWLTSRITLLLPNNFFFFYSPSNGDESPSVCSFTCRGRPKPKSDSCEVKLCFVFCFLFSSIFLFKNTVRPEHHKRKVSLHSCASCRAEFRVHHNSIPACTWWREEKAKKSCPMLQLLPLFSAARAIITHISIKLTLCFVVFSCFFSEAASATVFIHNNLMCNLLRFVLH